MDKPLTLMIKETTDIIINDINKSGLPAYVLINILSDVINQIRMADEQNVQEYIRQQNMKQIKKDKKGSDK